MQRALRAAVAGLLVLGTTALLLGADAAAPRPAHQLVAGPPTTSRYVNPSVPPTTTTTAPTTTIPPEPPKRPQRASRRLERPRPPVTSAAPAGSSNYGDCNAWGWTRTKQQSDDCWRDEVAKYPGWNVSAMLTIMYCESHGDPWAGRRYVGLLQVDNAPETRGNGPANIAVGYRKFEGQGYSAWPTCRHRAGV